MRTRISCHFLFEPYEMAQPRFDASEVTEFWDLVNRQDWAICEAVQAGMSARVHEAGVFSPWRIAISTSAATSPSASARLCSLPRPTTIAAIRDCLAPKPF